MKKWLHFFIALLLFSSCFLHAQQLITSYSVADGLPQSSVTSLFRDDSGYLWCGTGGGLGLYDGWEFHVPKSTGEKVNPSLTSTVRSIIASEDRKTMWVGSEMNVSQYDRLTYSILHSYDVVKEVGVAEMPMYANDTAVWVICWGKGLYRVRTSDGKSVRITSASIHHACALSSDRKSIVFPDTTGQIIIYDIASALITKIRMPAALFSDHITCIKPLPFPASEILFLTEHGIWKFDLKANSFTRFFLQDQMFVDSVKHFRALGFHPDGSWWFGVMDEGVYRYDPIQKKIRSCVWQQDGTNMSSLMLAPSHIVCDGYGTVWCGTDGNGVIKLLHNRVAFHTKFTSSLVTDTCHWFTRTFYELSPDRYLVAVFRGGLRLVDHTSNTIRTVTSGPLWANVTAHFITESGDGRLLIGTNESLLLLDTINWTTEAIGELYPQEKFTGYVRSDNGNLLLYGNFGIRIFEISPKPAIQPPIVMAGVTSAIEISPGRIIAATIRDGLLELGANGVLVRTYPYDTHMNVPVTTEVHGMFVDLTGQLWLGTETGLMVTDRDFRYLRSYTTADGLSDNLIYAVEPLSDHSFALGTARGLTLYDINNSEARTYTSADGLPSDECNSGAVMFSNSRQLYIGTPAGFVVWNPLDEKTCYRSAQILVSYNSGEKEITVENGGSIERDYSSGSVELRIWITDFAFPQRTEFTHLLEGAGDVAITEIGLRKVNYTALGSGFYSFLCSATIPGCRTIERAKLMTIRIIPPYWMSGWFIAITSMGAVVIITLILFVIMRLNYQRKIRKLKMQQELDKIRQRISRDIHDEIGAGLTRIALSGDLMSQKVAAGEVTSEKLKWISGTARELSQSMKEVVWSVNPHYDSLDHMAAYFRSYVSGVAENADVRFVYLSDDKLPSIAVNPETRRNLLLILKETISNAVKYADASELRLEIHWKDNKFSMLIADNGKGFDLQGPSGVNSNGIRNIRQRAEASGCMLTITTAPGKGTSIRIRGSLA